MKDNFIWCKCVQWQDWMAVQTIELGQPMLKNDRFSKLLDLEERAKHITYAHPQLRGFDSTKPRYYLPISLTQVCEFLIVKGFVVTIKMNSELFIMQYSNSKIGDTSRGVQGRTKDWYHVCSNVVKEIFDVQIV